MLSRDCVSQDKDVITFMIHYIHITDNTKTEKLLIHKKVYVFKVTCMHCSLSRRVQKFLQLQSFKL